MNNDYYKALFKKTVYSISLRKPSLNIESPWEDFLFKYTIILSTIHRFRQYFGSVTKSKSYENIQHMKSSDHKALYLLN